MMDHENENECTSTSTDDVEMMNSKSTAPSGNDIANSINDSDSEVTSMNMKNGESEEKIVVASDNEVNSSSSPSNDIDDDNHVVNSPEPEDLTIDEGDSTVMHDDADANNEDNNEDVDMYSDICPAPVVIEKTETDESASELTDPLPLEKTVDEESPSSPPLEKSEEDSPTSPPVDTTQDNPSSPPQEGPLSPPPAVDDSRASPPQDGPLSPPPTVDESQDGPSSPDEQVVRSSSPEIASPSPKPLNEDSISSDFQKHILSQEDIVSENNDDDDDDDDNDDNKGFQSPDVSNLMIGTPISLEESQSQPSPPVLTVKKKVEKVLVVKKTDDDEEIEEGEDLEDGEIMDEEEEEPMEVDEVKPVAAVVVAPQRSSKKESSSSKSSSKSKDKSSDKKKREKEKENVDELDPVKRLLAEVREKDNREREEREKRRKEKKRSHKDDKEKPPKEKEPNTKKKKRRMTEEEEEGEEFLFVRGASPSAGPAGGSGDTENWDQIDDRRGGKRRRESDDGASPGHRHRRGGHEGSNSPTRANRIPDRPTSKRQDRREPKSDVICAYFMQGKCQKSADQCNFSHAAIPPRKMELCKFWMMECCAKKEKCLYLHNDFPCKYFHTGLICRQGDKCKFSHNPLSDVTKQVLLKHIETAPKEILGDFPRLNRTGALNLINKMEAKIKGLPYDEEENNENDIMQHGGPPHGHGGQEGHDRHGPPPDRHSHQDRHHDRSRETHRGHFGGPGHHDNSRGRRGGHDHRGGGDRGGGGGGGGPPDNHRGGDRDRRQSRWEQSQPTRGDQEKLQELMSEAGISGFYKDTMGGEEPSSRPNQGQPPLMSSVPTTQSQMFPPQMQNMQPPLLSMLPPFLPQMLSQGQGMPSAVNNPALASVLAQLQIPSSSIVPPNIPSFPPPIDTSSPSHQNDDNHSQNKPSESSIPDNLPKMQRELFRRIQQQQKKNQNKVQTQVSSEPEEPEENWYSDDEEEDSKKKEERKAEINDQISSVLNQIRQQTQQQQQQQSSNTKEPESLKTFFGDTDLRSSTASSSTDFKDIDLRTSSSLFKKVNILPATEINASLSSHEPMVYRAYVVVGAKEKPDYSSVRQTLTPQAILMDPRLGPRKRSNSIPAPESPTDQSSESMNQPMSIPDITPVFDPRTMKSGNQPQGGAGGRGLLDTPNPFDSNSMSGMNMQMNDFNNPFNRDPRAQSGSNNPHQQQQPPQNSATAAQLAQNFAAVSALMQQQWPNGQPPIDPSSLFMLGFPFLPQAQGASGNQPQNPGLDFNMMQNHGGIRMRPPFMPGNQSQQQQPSAQPQQQAPPASSWERFNRGQGNLSPPL